MFCPHRIYVLGKTSCSKVLSQCWTRSEVLVLTVIIVQLLCIVRAQCFPNVHIQRRYPGPNRIQFLNNKGPVWGPRVCLPNKLCRVIPIHIHTFFFLSVFMEDHRALYILGKSSVTEWHPQFFCVAQPDVGLPMQLTLALNSGSSFLCLLVPGLQACTIIPGGSPHTE